MSYLKLLSLAIFFSFILIIGLYSAHSPILLPPHDLIHGDYGDNRLVQLLLEHNFQYFSEKWSSSYWSPTWQFYPFENNLAMSENMAGAAVLYSVWRLAGFEMQSAYQLWFVSASILNFAAAFFLSRSNLSTNGCRS